MSTTILSGLASLAIARRCVTALRSAGVLATFHYHAKVATIEAGSAAVYCIRVTTSEATIDPSVPEQIASVVRAAWERAQLDAADDRTRLSRLANDLDA